MVKDPLPEELEEPTVEYHLPEGWSLFENLVQEDLERFEVEKDKVDTKIPLGDSLITSVARNNRRWIVAAIRANWINAPCKEADLGKRDPAELGLIAQVVSRLYFMSVSPSEKKF